jgi:predicted alpha/beta-hydrolase family hydrolase
MGKEGFVTVRVAIAVNSEVTVSGLLNTPLAAQACYVLAHGAGAVMSHPFLDTVAEMLAERNFSTLRYQFPSMERGSKRPDPPAIAHATVRAAVTTAGHLIPGLPLFAGGKSFGGRMTSQAQASSELAGVRGLIFLGFPLHPAKRPSTDRADHLLKVKLPMLFLQGTRDDLANLPELHAVCDTLRDRAALHLLSDADHSFHVRARTGGTNQAVMREIADVIATWIRALVP